MFILYNQDRTKYITSYYNFLDLFYIWTELCKLSSAVHYFKVEEILQNKGFL